MQKLAGLVEKLERNKRRSLDEAMSGRKPLFPRVNCNGEQVITFVLYSIQLLATSRRVLIFADSDNTVIAAQSFNRKLDWLKIGDYSNPRISFNNFQAFRLLINVPRLCLACYNRGSTSGSALPGSSW
jgi:hypothetical protein